MIRLDQRPDWWIWFWRRTAPETRHRVPYSCDSWRCPHCAPHEAAVLFARLKEAVCDESLDPSGWVVFVLTIDREGYYSGQRWRDADTAYRELGRMSERLRKRLKRYLRRTGRDPFGRHWCAVAEQHMSGWPHLNLAIYCPDLAAEIRASNERRLSLGATRRDASLLCGEVLTHAMAAGWGRQSTGEVVRDREALCGYVTKLAKNADATWGEIAKVTQAPVSAPVRFRRLRSGVRFLPPRRKNPEWTGVMVRRVWLEQDLAWLAFPMHMPIDETSRAEVTAVQTLEEGLASAEEEADYYYRTRGRKDHPGLRITTPIHSVWTGGRQVEDGEEATGPPIGVARMGEPDPVQGGEENGKGTHGNVGWSIPG